MSDKQTRRWPNLSHYGVTLGIIEFEGGKSRLVFSDENGRYPHIAKNMGFQRTRWPGLWVRDDTRLEPSAFRPAFPLVRIEERSNEDIAGEILGRIRDVVDVTRARQAQRPEAGGAGVTPASTAQGGTTSARPRDAAPRAASQGETVPVAGTLPEASIQPVEAVQAVQPVQADESEVTAHGAGLPGVPEPVEAAAVPAAPELAQPEFAGEYGELIDLAPLTLIDAAYPLGLNFLGEDVFESRDGKRFVRVPGDDVSTMLMEAARTGQNTEAAGRFMRADTEQSFALAADGFVRAMAEGRVARVDDFAQFFRAVNERDMVEGDPDIDRVAAEIDKARVRRLAALVNNPDADAFGAALRLHEAAQYYSLVKAKMTPLPVGIVMQHIASAMPAGSTVRTGSAANGEFDIFMRGAGAFAYAEEDQVQDILLSAARPELLERSFEILGTSVARLDHAHVLQSLEQMAPNGLGIFVIGGDGVPGRIGPSSRRFLDALAMVYNVEGIVDMDGALTGAQGAGPARVIVVGARRATPGHGGLPTSLPYVTDYDALWAWGNNIAGAIRKPGSVPFSARGGVAETSTDERNSFQAPYIPTSLLSDPAMMVPRNMASPLRRAMLEVLRENPRIDDYLCTELGKGADELKAVLSAEQADAVVLGLKRLETGMGFMEADQTGVGKGRVLAALALAARRRGEPVVFLTEKAHLFTDFWRDLEDIGADKEFANVFIVNDDTAITSTLTGEVVARSAPRGEVESVMRSMRLPPDVDILFATYSQFNRDPAKAARQAAGERDAPAGLAQVSAKVAEHVKNLNKVRAENGREAAKPMSVEAVELLSDPAQLALLPLSALKPLWIGRAVEGAMLTMDESHNAAGEVSQTNLNMVHAVMRARDCIYSSATFARGERNMRIYRRLFPQSVDVENLHETLKKGGEPLQESLTAMLAEDGALVRREHDCSMLKFETRVDKKRVKRTERDADQLAEILALMAALSRESRQYTDAISEDLREKLAALHTGPGGKLQIKRSELKKVGVVQRSSIGNSLHTIMRAFITIQKIDFAVESGIEAMRAGQKPVFVIPHTMEAELNRAIERAERSGQAQQSDDGLVIRAPGFRQMLLDTLETLLECSLDGRELELKKSPEFAELVRAIEDKIRVFPNLTLSPLDKLREGLNQAGYQVAELSGRKWRATSLAGGKALVTKISSRERKEAVARFNNGDAEAIILTAAGNSGISLHASPRFINTAQRVMIEVEVPANIVERTQFFGRVNRNGQLSHPSILTLSSGLPAEERILAMMNNHMRKMSASVTGNRDNAALTKDIADILNQLGNRVVCYFLEARPALAQKLDIDLPEVLRNEDDEFVLYGSRYVSELFMRLVLLKVADQRDIIHQITTEFNALVEELDAAGTNPLRAKFYDVNAATISSAPLEHVAQSAAGEDQLSAEDLATYGGLTVLDKKKTAARPQRKTCFDRPVNISEIEYTEFFESHAQSEIKKMVARGSDDLSDRVNINFGPERAALLRDEPEAFYASLIDIVLNRRDEMMAAAVSSKHKNVAEALADDEQNLVKTVQYQSERLAAILAQLRIGSVIDLVDALSDQDVRDAVVTGLYVPHEDFAHYPGRYSVSYVAPGHKGTFRVSLSALIKQGSRFAVKGELDANAFKAFAAKRAGSHIVSRSVLDGNLFRAAELSLSAAVGTQATYSDKHGMTHRAVVLPYSASAATFSKLPLRIHEPELAISYFQSVQRGELFSLSGKFQGNRALAVKFDGEDLIISVPGSAYWSAWLRSQTALMAVTGRFDGTSEAVMAVLPRSACRELIGALYATGVTLYAHPNGNTVSLGPDGKNVYTSTRAWFAERLEHLNAGSDSTEQPDGEHGIDPFAREMGRGKRRLKAA